MFVRSSILGDSVSGDASLHRCSDYLLSKIVNHDHCLCLRSNIRLHRGLIALISDQHFPRDPSVRYSGTKGSIGERRQMKLICVTNRKKFTFTVFPLIRLRGNFILFWCQWSTTIRGRLNCLKFEREQCSIIALYGLR